jgi:hypothetical protein
MQKCILKSFEVTVDMFVPPVAVTTSPSRPTL